MTNRCELRSLVAQVKGFQQKMVISGREVQAPRRGPEVEAVFEVEGVEEEHVVGKLIVRLTLLHLVYVRLRHSVRILRLKGRRSITGSNNGVASPKDKRREKVRTMYGRLRSRH